MWTELLIAMLVAGALAPLLALAVRFRAPGRRDTRLRSILGFFVPLTLFVWAALAWITAPGMDVWGTLWGLIGAVSLGVALLLSSVANPPRPSETEARRADRRGELLDPVYFMYILAVGLACLAAGVTRVAWSDLA